MHLQKVYIFFSRETLHGRYRIIQKQETPRTMAKNPLNESTVCKECFDKNRISNRTYCIKQLTDSSTDNCPLCYNNFYDSSDPNMEINATNSESLELGEEREAARNSQPEDNSQVEMMAAKKGEKNETCNNNTLRIMKERDRVKEMIENNEKIKRNVILNHTRLKDDITNKIKDLEAQCLLEVDYLENENETLNYRLEELEEMIEHPEDVSYDFGIASSETDTDEDETSNSHFQTWLKELQEMASKEEMILREISKASDYIGKMINSLGEVLEYPDEGETVPTKQKEAILLLGHFTGKLSTPDKLQNPGPAIKYLENLNGIYAIDEQGSRSAKISFSWDNKILLHCLTYGELPSHVCTLQHRQVISLVNPSSRTVFLDLATSESTLGRMFINLTPNTKRADNFSLLCSGEIGPSYLNTSIAHLEGESALFGKFERHEGRGKQALVPGSGEEMGEIFGQPEIAGSLVGLYGDNLVSQFWITTRDNTTEFGSIVFGQVESGLQVLREAIAMNPIRNKVRIIDCGIVISL